jgi:hypothetical protein
MRPVRRDEIVDFETYEDQREAFREQIFEVKRARRIHVGEYLTFLFENTDTTRYQVQEMMRAEKIVREADIQHELDTYNALLGGHLELGCTLLIEIESEAERDEKLVRWLNLPESLYLRLEDGRRVSATFDPAQVGEGRLSSVQYLKFKVGAGHPVALGVEGVEGLDVEAELSPDQHEALKSDLAGPV